MAAAVLLTAWARVAPAAVPDATMSYAGPVILGGSSGTAPDDTYLVIVRTVGGTLKSNAYVTLNFAGTGARPYEQQLTPDSVNCTTHVLYRWTGLDGVALFHPRLAGFENAPVIQVRANAVLLKSVPARSTDLNADGATDIQDVALFRERLLGNRLAPETDFNADGVTDVMDLDILRAELFSGARGTPCP